MSLDKLTLHAQLSIMEKNMVALDNSINERTTQLQSLVQQSQAITTELERTRGARQYHDLLVQQIRGMLEIADKESATSSSPTVAASQS